MKLALITPSYLPDLDRCDLLSQTIDRWVEHKIDHVVIVPKKDYNVFKKIPKRSKVVTVESILPRHAWQIPFMNKWWLTACTFPIRGWIIQQLVKISACAYLDYDVCVFIDSDVVIIRPLTIENFVREGKVRLYRVPGAAKTEMHMRWHRNAAKILGIKVQDYLGADYIGQIVSWSRHNVLDMLNRIENIHQKHWFLVLGNTLHFAEYILYGIYVDCVKEQKGNYFSESFDLCHCSWHYKIDTLQDMGCFFEKLQDKHVAILIQSNQGFNVDSYRQILKSKKIIE